VLADLTCRRSLDHKIKEWPKRVLGQPIDLGTGAGKAFMELKGLRNSLMHFTSTHSTLDLFGQAVEGLSDTSALDELTDADAERALVTAEDFVGAVLLARSGSPQAIPRGLHLWTGKVPL
jgi:hypothetical protein